MKKSVSVNSRKNHLLIAGDLLLLVSFFSLLSIGIEYKKEEDSYRQLEQAAMKETISKDTDHSIGDGVRTDSSDFDKDTDGTFDYFAVQIDFEMLKQVNEDIIGWILFDFNGISYPILQGEDNEEYLYTLADKTENKAGSIFMDAACASDFSDVHTIIYGHNMKNLSMFGKLKYYRTKADYYKENCYFTIYTPDKICRYEIFAWYEASEDDSVYQVGFKEDEVFDSFVGQMLNRRYTDTGIRADKEDKIVTLSTCSSNGKRFLVHGKLIAFDVN